ncbi:alpha/beta fold hydrolase [Rhizobium sp. PL01]|uniref:alpha/beta hydrolase family protein n=1 Tax=Rhizobium sp. PL01 TaxID=3085631 RepID=UPI002981E6C3|nr:alpha/beta fold hydrolase [Rhizobium sp. PL01]MDW5312771.1 alpha/beta fold hydrolase [Rhizobium sp. PL01]
MLEMSGKPIGIACPDGVRLGGHIWTGAGSSPCGAVVINPATGVLARYYHPYARFLAEHGFTVLTYDYRGIGQSRPASLRGCTYRWADWGEQDFAAALGFLDAHVPDGPRLVVGHSIGGFLPGFALNAPLIDRMLTVGAQYAYWRDYASARRLHLLLKWHLAMPVLTALCGYFPGRTLGWLEDLPAGVAKDWSFRRARMEFTHPSGHRPELLQRFAAVTAGILAIGVTDDDIGTPKAIRRALRYYENARPAEVMLSPTDLGLDRIGHFSLFHKRHAADFWLDSLLWLRDGINPWPDKPFGPQVQTNRNDPFNSRCYIPAKGMM